MATVMEQNASVMKEIQKDLKNDEAKKTRNRLYKQICNIFHPPGWKDLNLVDENFDDWSSELFDSCCLGLSDYKTHSLMSWFTDGTGCGMVSQFLYRREKEPDMDFFHMFLRLKGTHQWFIMTDYSPHAPYADQCAGYLFMDLGTSKSGDEFYVTTLNNFAVMNPSLVASEDSE